MKRIKQLIILGLSVFLSVEVAHASDHRSPLNPPELWVEEARLTDLYFWPEGNYFNLVFTFFGMLIKRQAINLMTFEFGVFFDLNSKGTSKNRKH